MMNDLLHRATLAETDQEMKRVNSRFFRFGVLTQHKKERGRAKRLIQIGNLASLILRPPVTLYARWNYVSDERVQIRRGVSNR